jgi:hypothetical protein
MTIIGDIVTRLLGGHMYYVTGYEPNRTREGSLMSNEGFIPDGDHGRLPEGDDFEEMLEIMIKIAQSEGREFLAYLLRMALMEARNHDAPTSFVSH